MAYNAHPIPAADDPVPTHPHFPHALLAVSYYLYPPPARTLDPQPSLTATILSANLYLSRLHIGELPAYSPPADPDLPGPAKWVTAALRDVLEQLEKKAWGTIGKEGIVTRTVMPMHLERWHMQLVWFMVAFFESGCGVKVTVGVDNKTGSVMVQFPRIGEKMVWAGPRPQPVAAAVLS